MSLHHQTFDHLKPTDSQLEAMGQIRTAFAELAAFLDARLPDGPDKTYVLRKVRECAMWANVALTRQPDGSPRADQEDR